MPDLNAVVGAAKRLHRQKDDVALELLIGLREKAIEQDPTLMDNVDFEPKYEVETMGALDDLKALGRRILNRWNKELYGVVCGNKGDDQKAREAVLDSLNLGEAAVIAAVASALGGALMMGLRRPRPRVYGPSPSASTRPGADECDGAAPRKNGARLAACGLPTAWMPSSFPST